MCSVDFLGLLRKMFWGEISFRVLYFNQTPNQSKTIRQKRNICRMEYR